MAKPSSAGDSTSFSACHLLLVDDDEDFVVLVRRCLRQMGLTRSRHCSNGAAAIEALKEKDWLPSLVVLDHKMPLRTGLEVLAWIRSEGLLNGFPVFMLSTGSEPELIAEAFKLGAEGYYVKPMSVAQLLANLGHMLAYWKAGVRGGIAAGSARAATP